MSHASITLFTLFYSSISACFVFRTSEFVSAGLTIEYIFDWYLKSEHENFLLYHMKRNAVTLLVHSCLPLAYVLGVIAISEGEVPNADYEVAKLFWSALKNFSFLLPTLSFIAVSYWRQNNWSYHPLVKNLKAFCEAEQLWRSLSSEINAEYRNIDKVILRPSPLTTIVATDNWLIKVSPYSINLSRNGFFVLSSTDEHVSEGGRGLIQYLNISVHSLDCHGNIFTIRCKTEGFRELRGKLNWPVVTLPGITFHKTNLEEFASVFRETIDLNPSYVIPEGQEIETCIGCTLTPSDVKLKKNCDGLCTECHCRPLWCCDCMAKWFASRQEQDRPETWLSSNCTCPVCRSIFCVLDVCPVTSKNS